ncbi:MAG: MATE family efflux transporter [Pseudomonadota bacterium]
MGAPLEREPPITYARVSAIALPVVLSNGTAPLQGAIDTAIIGNLGSEVLLAAVAIGAAMFSLILGVFNFLQIGTSGPTAQALGAQINRRVINVMIRGLLLAAVIALILFFSSGMIARLGLSLFEGSDEAEALAARYFTIRAYGFPAELGNYVVLGWFTGQAMTRRMFEMQLVISGVNIALTLLLVLGLGWGITGVALGTALASYCGLAYGLWRARQRCVEIAPSDYRLDWSRLLDRRELTQAMSLNRDIFIRSFLLVFCLMWMTRLGSTLGDTVLAANGILMQFLHISAAALDGFAIATETLVGQAIGAGSRSRLRRAVIVSTIAALVLAMILSIAATALGDPIIRGFTNVAAVREAADDVLLWATFLPLIGVLSYQFDGVFFGAADGPSMRNSMVLTALVYLPLSWWMTADFGNHGVWGSFWVFLLLRALFLILRYPMLEARASSATPSDNATV